MRRHILLIATIIFIGWGTVTPAHAEVITITTCDFASLQSAVRAANDSHEPITFTCSGTIVFTERLFISGHVTIIGGGNIIFDGGGREFFFQIGDSPREFPPPTQRLVSSSLILDGLTLQNGVSPIQNDHSGTLILNNVTLTQNEGEIFNWGAVIITNSTFNDNTGYDVINYGTVVITHSTFSDSVILPDNSGEALRNNHWMSIQNSHFENIICSGTGILVNNGGNTSRHAQGCPSDTPTTVVSNCTNFKGAGTLYEAVTVANVTGAPITFTCEGVIEFTEIIFIQRTVTINGGGNIIFDGGGGESFFRLYEDASLTLNDLTLQNGDAPRGNRGAIEIYSGTLTLNNSTIRGHHSMDSGYAIIYNHGTLTISNSTFKDNSSLIIYSEGRLTINDSTFSDNGVSALWNTSETAATISNSTFSHHSGERQAVIANSGNLTISNSTFSDNFATELAGAISNRGTLFIIDSTFTGNSLISDTTDTDKSGAIYNMGTLFITNSAFADNTSQHCGAIYNYEALTITNSTFTENSATQNGGTICNVNRLTISNSTFTGNSATVGGAIINQSILITPPSLIEPHRTGRISITDSTFVDNVATTGGAIFSDADATVLSQDTHYENNACVFEGIFTDNGGNTADNADGCLYQP